jgi:hypothetical protein
MGELPPKKAGGLATGLSRANIGLGERMALAGQLDLACCAFGYGTPYRIH